MQTGVEIHLHQGKPGVRAANTHRVGQAFRVRLITQKPDLERLFEHGLNLHLGTDSSSSECTPRDTQTIDDSSIGFADAPPVTGLR
jgi:hypothetical protein